MFTKLPATVAAALVVVLLEGCENAPPGAGITNGPPPTVLGAEEKPAVRTDLQEPDATAGSAASTAAAAPVTGPSPTLQPSKSPADAPAETPKKPQ